MVGLAVLRTTAASIRAAGPKCSISASTLSSTESWPVRAATSSSSCAIAGVIRTGHSCRPIAATASEIAVIGVVGVAHRPVAGRAVGPQPQPGQPLLRSLDEVDPLPLHGGGEAADLSDPLGAALEPLRVLVGQRMRTLDAARLLVGREREGDRPLRQHTRTLPGPDDGQDRRVEVLHVDRTAAPDVAVLLLGRERVDLPVGLGGRYDVQVAVQEQPVGGVRIAPVRHDRGPPLRRLEQLRADPDLVEQTGDVLGSRPLPRTRVVAVVRGVDPDQVAADLHDLGLGLVRLRHTAHLAPRQPEHSPARRDSRSAPGLRRGARALLRLVAAQRAHDVPG